MNQHITNDLRFRALGIDTQDENIVYMRADCHICVSEGFETLTRVVISFKDRKLIATLNVIRGNLLAHGEGSLSEKAGKELGISEGDHFSVSHLPPIESLSHVRAKMYGKTLGESEIVEIISDVAKGNYSNVHLSALVAATAGDKLNLTEIVALTKAMVNVGERIQWDYEFVADKHCVGGLPGNRTTPIVVAICAAAGLRMPKTSSRAITSPAGTADAMEVITNVNLPSDKIKDIVQAHGGCIAWGGAVKLSPADDILIRVEKALDIDSEGQMIASVLSKKVAAGSTHVVIDIPVGSSAKVRSNTEAEKLREYFVEVGKAVGLQVKVVITDGSQPVGIGIGPALEAADVLKVLRNEEGAPSDLRNRAITIAATLLELVIGTGFDEAFKQVEDLLSNGKAWKKFQEICEAQGRFSEPNPAEFQHNIVAEHAGTVIGIDNRRLARAAKLAGAPADSASGIEYFAPIGKAITKGQLLYRIHAESKGELKYALEYINANPDIITIRP